MALTDLSRICGVTSQTSASVSLTKKGKNMTLRSEEPEILVPFPTPTQGPFEGQSHWGGPQGNWVTTRECCGGRGGRGRRKRGGSKRAKLYLVLESDFPLHCGCHYPPSTQHPVPTEPHRAAPASLPPSGFSLSAPPPLGPRPRTQPGSSSSGRVSAADPPARPPTRRRQGLPNQTAEGCRAGPGRASQAPPGPTCEAGGGSVCSPAGGQSHKQEEEAGRKQGSALPTSRRKQLERRAARNSQPSTRHRRRSGDIKQEDGAKDHRLHERPRHQRRSARAIVQGRAVERR